jgi:hypothetical protein
VLAKKRKGGGNTVCNDLAIFLNDVEEGGPFHEVGEVEIKVIIFRQSIEIGLVHAEEVVGSGAANGGHSRCFGRMEAARRVLRWSVEG